eukprot:8155209-Alexandrium_andersonii.AAC.1
MRVQQGQPELPQRLKLHGLAPLASACAGQGWWRAGPESVERAEGLRDLLVRAPSSKWLPLQA